MSGPLVSVLIVTWNCRDLIGPCLDHLLASRLDDEMEVIVVDNASRDGTAEVVRSGFAGVEVIESGGNLGFGRGNNLAARRAQGEYLLLLNPDAYLTDPDALGQLCAALDADRKGAIAAVAPMLVNQDESHQVGDAGFAPSVGNIVRHQMLVSRFVPGTRGFYINRPALLRRDRVRVQWLAATCLLVRRAAFEQVGGFDPSFFMYGEDVDLGLRLNATGRTQFLLPAVRVVHLQGATQRTDPDALHVSFGWIDAIFALHRGADWRDRLNRRAIAAVMSAGFLARAAAYRLKGTRTRAKSAAMMQYARHSWNSRRPTRR